MSVIVYTTIFGGSDSLKRAPSGASRCICFVDDHKLYAGQSRGWELIQVAVASDPRRAAWHLRCVPQVLFPDARKTVWIDASFTLTDLPRLLMDANGHDLCALRHHTRTSCYEEGQEVVRVGQAEAGVVARQLDTYRAEGFRPSVLTIGCLLVRAQTPDVTAFNELWDDEIIRNPGDNCQLSLDYAACKTGVGVHHLKGVRKDNPYAIHDHSDHKKRRQPYAKTIPPIGISQLHQYLARMG